MMDEIDNDFDLFGDEFESLEELGWYENTTKFWEYETEYES